MPKPNYLHEFIGALSAEEKATLGASLKGKEQALLDLYLSGNGKAPTKGEIASALSMSSSHIDKTSSVVLKKCYEVLAPGSRELWLWLRQRKLIRHFYHELNLEERELTTCGVTEELAKFYFDAFEALHTMSFQDYDPVEASRLMRRYFELKPDATPAERIMIEARLIRQRITNAQARGKIDEVLRTVENDLARLESLIDNTVPSLPLCQFYLAYAHYYKVIVNGKTERQRHYLGKTLAIMEQEYHEYTDEDRVLLKCKIGDTYYQESNFSKAYTIYNDIIPKCIHLFKAQFFYTSTFAQLSILCADFEATDRIINEFYCAYLAEGNGQPATTGAIQLAKRYLLDAHPEKAYEYIKLGFAANDKGLLVAFDFELRKLEAIYFALADAAFAEDLIDKHLKFLQSKGLSVKTNSHAVFFKLLRAILGERSGASKLSTVQIRQLSELEQGFGAIYGRLLSVMRKK